MFHGSHAMFGFHGPFWAHGSLGSPGPPGSFGSHVSYGSLASPGPPGSLWSLEFNGILSFLIEVSKLLRFVISEYLLYMLGMGVAARA